jgi:exodeoxyribonuclease III
MEDNSRKSVSQPTGLNLFTFFNTLSKEEDDHQFKAGELENIDIDVKKTTKVKLNPEIKPKGKSQLSTQNSVASKFLKTFSKPEVHVGDGKIEKDSILISTWNINGIRQISNKGLLQEYLKNHNVDILCLNESKVDEESFVYENLEKHIPEGYYHYWNFCKVKKGYSGVAILSKFKPMTVICDMGVAKHDNEGRVITLEFEKFNLVAVYVPNAGDECKRLGYRCDEWEPDFRNFLSDLRKKKPTILAGDLNVAQHNIDVYNPKQKRGSACFTDEERAEFEKMRSDGWIDVYRTLHPEEVGYTYYGYRTNKFKRSSGLRIDYFMCCPNTMPMATKCEPRPEVLGSDHAPLHLHLNFAPKEVSSNAMEPENLQKN